MWQLAPRLIRSTSAYSPAAGGGGGLTLGTLVANNDNFGYGGTTYTFNNVACENMDWLVFGIITTEGGAVTGVSIDGGSITDTEVYTSADNSVKILMANVAGATDVDIAVTSDASINNIGCVSLPCNGINSTPPSGGAVARLTGFNANPLELTVTVPTGGFVFITADVGQATSPTLSNGGTLAVDVSPGNRNVVGVVKSSISGSQAVGINTATNFTGSTLVGAAFGA